MQDLETVASIMGVKDWIHVPYYVSVVVSYWGSPAATDPLYEDN